MEHPRGSGAESLMSSGRVGTQRARGEALGWLHTRHAWLGAQSALLVSIQSVISF